MIIPGLQEVKKQRQSLRGKPLRGYQRLLAGIGNYFRQTLPSAIDDSYVLEVEALLNELYLRISDEGQSPDLEEAILKALGMAAQLGRAVRRNPGGEHDNRFFETAKRLGKALILISKPY